MARAVAFALCLSLLVAASGARAAGSGELHDLEPDAARPSGTLPGARAVSAFLFADDANAGAGRDPHGMNSLSATWGQFLDHTLILTTGDAAAAYNLSVPEDDPVFLPSAVLPFTPSLVGPGGQPHNCLTPFIDATTVYGLGDEHVASAPRAFEGGLLADSEEGWPPLRDDGSFIVGDPRGNEVRFPRGAPRCARRD